MGKMSINDKDCRDTFDIYIKGYVIGSLPIKVIKDTVPQMEGSIIYGREIDPRPIAVECQLNNNSPESKLNLLMIELMNTCRLVFAREPDKFFYADYEGSFEPENIGNLKTFTLPFICNDPFKYAIEETRLGFGQSTFNLTNNGTWKAKPTITITANSSQVSLVNKHNGQSFVINNISPGDIIEIDVKTMDVLINGDDENTEYAGDFIELESGVNSFSGSGYSQIEFVYHDTYA